MAIKFFPIAILTLSILAACGGSDSISTPPIGSGDTGADTGGDTGSDTGGDTGSDTGGTTEPMPIVQLQRQTSSIASLRPVADQTEAHQLLKNGLLYQSNNYYHWYLENDLVDTGSDSVTELNSTPTPMPAPIENQAPTDGVGQQFSQTNLIEAGVDEADRVKYDGEHLYVIEEPQLYVTDSLIVSEPISDVQAATSPLPPQPEEENSKIRILAAGETTDVNEVNTIELDANYHLSSLYLKDKQLIAIAPSHYQYWNFADLAYPGYWHNGSVEVFAFDVQDTSAPTETSHINLEGHLLDSRRIDDHLYLVSQYSPQAIANLNGSPVSEQDMQANMQQVESVDASQLVPQLTIDDNPAQPLFDVANCLVPDDVKEDSSLNNVLAITAINLADLADISSQCVSTPVDGFYMSPNALYLTAQTSDEMAIHKFSLDGSTINYQATGNLSGNLQWRASAFRMSEHNDLLRVVTTRIDNDFDHKLFVLQTNSDTKKLEPIAELPNAVRTQAIGKPGEDIYSVRFNGDKAYIVTFEQVDPLYVLDLSQADDPKIAGELEIPGFSQYLHILPNDLLLGLGQDADSMGNLQGLKLALFDVSDINNPSQVNQHLYPSYSSSSALYDHHALSFLKLSDAVTRLALPAEVYTSGNNWQHTGLQLFDINTTATPSLSFGGVLKAEDSNNTSYPFYRSDGRSVIHQDVVHYVHGQYVFSAEWQDPDNAVGPK